MKMNLNACCNQSSDNGPYGILTSLDSSVNHASYAASALRRVRQNGEANINHIQKTSVVSPPEILTNLITKTTLVK